jgi:hypothetical protein
MRPDEDIKRYTVLYRTAIQIRPIIKNWWDTSTCPEEFAAGIGCHKSLLSKGQSALCATIAGPLRVEALAQILRPLTSWHLRTHIPSSPHTLQQPIPQPSGDRIMAILRDLQAVRGPRPLALRCRRSGSADCCVPAGSPSPRPGSTGRHPLALDP